MKRAFWLVLLVLASAPKPVYAQAPPTLILTPTNRLGWNWDATNPLVTLQNFRADFYLKAAVTCSGTPVVCAVPTTPPNQQVDFGKPTPDGTGLYLGPLLSGIPVLQPGVEYFATLRAIASGGLVSPPSNVVGPFGFPGPPSAPTGLVVK